MNFKRLPLTLLCADCRNRDATDKHSPYFIIPVGSRLMLHQTVTVPAFAAEMYLPGGL